MNVSKVLLYLSLFVLLLIYFYRYLNNELAPYKKYSSSTLLLEETEIKKTRDFKQAKIYLHRIYRMNPKTFYCSCFFVKNKVFSDQCKFRLENENKQRLEWEHIVPASFWS